MTIIIKRIAIPFLILNSFISQAQNDTSKSSSQVSSDLKISYNSSMIYPGARAGLEIPIRLAQKTIIKKSGYQKIIYKEFLLSANISWYHHTSFQDNIYFTLEAGLRRTQKNGFFFDFSSGWGYSRTFLGATTYKVDDNGNVSIERYAGYNYALFIIGDGVGYDFSKNYSIPFSIFSKISILTMYPYNSAFYLRPTIEFGIIYYPSNFIRVKPKIKSIVKYL
jgi:hypothetical protein